MKALQLLTKQADVFDAYQNSGSAVKSGIETGLALGAMTMGTHYGTKFLNNKLTNAINSGKITDAGQLALAKKLQSGLGKVQHWTSLKGIGGGIQRVGAGIQKTPGLLSKVWGLGKSLLR